MNQTSDMMTGDSTTSASGNPLFDAHVAEQLREAMRTKTEKGACAMTNYGLVTKGDTPSYVGYLVALSTELVRGDESKKPIKKGVPRETTAGISRARLAGLVSDVMSELRHHVKGEGCDRVPDATGLQILLDLIKICFNLRDIRGTYGKGERRLFLWMLIEIHSYIPNVVYWLVHEIPHYGSYKDLADLYEMVFVDQKNGTTPSPKKLIAGKGIHNMLTAFNLKDIIVEIYAMQLDMDWIKYSHKSGDISLCTRWFPKEGRALYKVTRTDSDGSVTSRVAKLLFPNEFADDFRKAMGLLRRRVATLNKHLDTVQIKMSAKEFRNIDFKKLPGRATTKFRKAWNGEDKKGVFAHTGVKDREACRDHWVEHLKTLESGTVKAKGKAHHIHEIVDKLMDGGGYSCNASLKPDDIILYNAQFQSHIDGIIQFADENGTKLPPTVVVADVSGSMSGDPMAVAIGMAILCSTKGVAHPTWENIVLPFSSDPVLIKLQYPTSAHEWAATKAYNRGARCGDAAMSIYNNNALGNTFDPSQAGRELTPYEKVQVLLRMDWGMSTNFVGALDLLAMRAIQAGVKMPRVLVVSDMEFDASTATSQSSTVGGPLAGFDERKIIHSDWIIEPSGSSWDPRAVQYRNTRTGNVTTHLPADTSKPLIKTINEVLADQPCGSCEKVVFWNAQSSRAHPCGADDTGLIQVGGFSSNMLKLFFQSGDLEASVNDPVATSWDALRTTLDCEDYDRISAIVAYLPPWTKGGISRSALRDGSLTEEQKASLKILPCTWRTIQSQKLMTEKAAKVGAHVTAAWERSRPCASFNSAGSGASDVSFSSYRYGGDSSLATQSTSTSKSRCAIRGKPVEGIRDCTSCAMPAPAPRPPLSRQFTTTPGEGGGAGRFTDSNSGLLPKPVLIHELHGTGVSPSGQANPYPISLTDRMDGLELNVFGVSCDYDDSSILNRIDELERSVFGKKNTTWDSITARVAHLEKTLCG
jgi:hypothetical protein